MLQEDGSIKTKIYRKPTHTNQYLNFESHHSVIHKLSVVQTLFDRNNNNVTEQIDWEEEEKEITRALTSCGYPYWTMKRTKKTIETAKEGNVKRKTKQ